MDIMDFVSARLDEQQSQADNVRASLASNPPLQVASYAQGFIDYHDRFKELVDAAATSTPEARLENLPLLYAATSFSDHPDFDPAWNWRGRAH